MTQSEVEKLLGRDLSADESSNFDLYIEIGLARLGSLLCVHIGDDTEATRTYFGREGYSILYVDPFTALNKVEVDGNEVDVKTQQWDDPNGTWKNALILEMGNEIDVTATFGYGDDPEFQLLLARAFDLISTERTTDTRVSQKRNEDYQVTYGRSGEAPQTVWEAFKHENASTLAKYSQCGIGQLQSGDTDKDLHRTRR